MAYFGTTRPSNDRPVFQPLKSEVMWILLALMENPLHGYGILVWIRERSGSEMEPGTGQLYRHIKRLLDDDWITETEPPPGEESDDPRRRYYRILPAGEQQLRAESRRLQHLVRLSRSFGLLVEEGS